MRNKELDILFEPLRMKNLTLKNRFFMAPMGTTFDLALDPEHEDLQDNIRATRNFLPDDPFPPPFLQDVHHPADRLLEKTVGFRFHKALAYAHLEHQQSPVPGVLLEKIEKVPHEFPDFVESA